MYNTIILSDHTPSRLGYPRYIGPYLLSTVLSEQNISNIIIDRFTHIEDFFTYLEQFLNEDTKVLGIANTFISYGDETIQQATIRKKYEGDYYRGYLWKKTDAELTRWFKQLRELLDRKSPDCKIVMGGSKSQLIYTEAIMSDEGSIVRNWHRFVDYVMLGSTDDNFTEVVKMISHGLEVDHDKHHNGIKFIFPKINPKDRRDVPVTYYCSNHVVHDKEWLMIETSRGCAFNCKFCNYFKRTSNIKDTSSLREEFIRNYELYGTTGYHFTDDCFNDSYDKVVRLTDCFESLPFKLEWVSYARTDLCTKYPDIIDRMIRTGCRGLYFGIETLSHEAGKKAGKGHKPELVKQTLEEFRRQGGDEVILLGSFIIGLPGETYESSMETLKWIVEQRPLDMVTFGVLGIYPSVKEEIDGLIYDYSYFSKMPEKFNIKVYKENYVSKWVHDTMSYDEATEIRKEWQKVIDDNGINSYDNHIFSYPNLRSLGYSHADTRNILINNINIDEAVRRNRNYIRLYHQRLLDYSQIGNQ